jgi:hypothetical protein
LGIYKQTLNKDPADGVAYYQDTPEDSLTFPLTEQEHLEILHLIRHVPSSKSVNMPRFAKCFRLRPQSALPREAFVVECKQHAEPLTSGLITEIVSKKFAKHPKCKLFFVIALSFSVRVLSDIYYPGYTFFMLVKKRNDEYELRRALYNPTRVRKCAILISLEEIWGEKFMFLRDLLAIAKC